MRTGMYSVTPGYEEYLKAVLEFQEGESPLAHLTKHEIVKGDVTLTLPHYLERCPETMISWPTSTWTSMSRPHYACARSKIA